jgi:hypothetical protein
MELWRKFAFRHFKKSEPLTFAFEVKTLPDDIAESIRYGLEITDSEDAIKQVFELKFSATQPREPAGSPEGGQWVNQEEPGGRAQGGVTTIGINDNVYLGGQFLPKTELDKQNNERRKKRKKYMERKQEIAPYIWELPPSFDVDSIYKKLGGIVPFRNGKFYPEELSQQTINDYRIIDIFGLSAKYNSGERWAFNQYLKDEYADLTTPKSINVDYAILELADAINKACENVAIPD